MKKILNKVFGIFTILALISSTTAPLVYAASGYTITIDSTSYVGLNLSISGSTGAHPYVGSSGQQSIQVTNWGDSSALTNATANLNFGGSGSNKFFDGTWSASHIYAAGGSYSITVKVCHQSCSGAEGSDFSTATTIVVIPPPNGAPTLSGVPASVTIPEVSPYTFTATATDADVPAQTLTFSLIGAPAGASINSSTGVFSWTPTEAQGPGDYSFTVSVSDGALSNTKPITIHVTEVDTPPTADAKSVTTPEDTAKDIVLTGSDSDLPVQSLTFTKTSEASNGSVVIVGSTATYTPNANFNGTDSFTYSVSGGSVDSLPATVTITVTPGNDAPTLADLSEQTVPELSAMTFTAVGADIDTGSTLSYSLSGAPTGSSINGSTGVFSWTPTEVQGPADYTFSVVVSDGSLSATKPVTIHVTEVNQAPVASDTTTSTHMDTPVNITLSGNDGDLPSNDPLSYTIVTEPNPVSGSITLSSGHTYVFTPASGFTGGTSFTFKVNDGSLDSNTATVTISVNNDAPTINQISDTSVNELSTLTLTAIATDPNESDTLSYSLADLMSTGATINSSTGVFSWTPTEAQGPGVYTFTINATDGGATTSTTFSVTVNEVNVAPTADAKSATTLEDNSVDIILSGSDSDIPSQTLSFIKVTDPVHGSVSIVGSTATYTPNANFNGTDSFTYKINDTVTDGEPATVSITVTPVNDAPTIVLTGESNPAIAFDGTFVDEGAACSDVDGEKLSPSVSGEVDTHTAGVYTLTYKCTDGGELSSEEVTRTVTVQSAPAACMDGKDNDQDEKTDYPADPGCTSETDNNETDPVVVIDVCPNIDGVQESVPQGKRLVNGQCVNNGGGGGGGLLIPTAPTPTTGQVLGASTSCGLYVNDYLKMGKKNNKDEVKKLQTFLNDYLKLKPALAVNGVFGLQTYKAVVKFQEQEAEYVLKPWVGITLKDSKKGTGYVFKTTVTRINNIMCPELNLTIPPLTL